jgi:hypothetical protein
MPQVLQRWSAVIQERESLSPLAAGWYTDLGPLSLWIHVWAYKDLGERTRAREAVS